MSEAPKSTVPSVSCRMPPPDPIGLIVDLNVRVSFVKLVKPLLIDGRGKRGSGGVDGFSRDSRLPNVAASVNKP